MIPTSLQSEIPVSKAILDQQESVVRKIDAANFAVYEAVIAICEECNDPVAMNLLGVDPEFLKAVLVYKNKIKRIGMTGIPIWSPRFATGDLAAISKSGGSTDALFKSLLKTFSQNIGFRSL